MFFFFFLNERKKKWEKKVSVSFVAVFWGHFKSLKESKRYVHHWFQVKLFREGWGGGAEQTKTNIKTCIQIIVNKIVKQMKTLHANSASLVLYATTTCLDMFLKVLK